MSVALLDGDSWVYRCGFAAEKTHYLVTCGKPYTDNFEANPILGVCDDAKSAKQIVKEQEIENPLIWTRKEYEPLENCLQMVKSSLENTLNVLGTKEYRLYLSGRRNFRDEVFSEYKANRDGMARPKYFVDIRDYLVSQWGARACDGFEADDAIGMDGVSLGSSAVIVAVDKDLDQIPGQHYNWVSGEQYSVSPKDGMRFFYEQLLSGDSTDNIPGLKGIGPAKATKALAECANPQECAGVVYSMYRQMVGGPPDAIIDRNAKLLWIWRKPNDKHPFWRHLGREPV